MDALDSILGILAAVTRWRVLLCLGASSVAGFAMYSVTEWMTGIQALTFAAFGAIPGVIWDEYSHQPAPTEQPSQPLVAVFSAALLSALWGLVSSSSAHSMLVGAAILAASAFVFIQLTKARTALIQRIKTVATGTICYALGCSLGYFQ